MTNNLIRDEKNFVKISSYNKTKELGRIIGLDGTTDILDLLDEKPRRYGEIESIIELSHATLLRRLNKLQLLNILKKKPIRSKRRETHVYDFTLCGIDTMRFIKSYDKEVSQSLSQKKIIEIEKNI